MEEKMKMLKRFFSFIINRKKLAKNPPPDYRSLIAPGRYRHFKGNYYLVWGVGKHSEIGEEFVVYGPEYRDNFEDDSKRIWLCPAAMFIEEVEHLGHKVPRFRKA